MVLKMIQKEIINVRPLKTVRILLNVTAIPL